MDNPQQIDNEALEHVDSLLQLFAPPFGDVPGCVVDHPNLSVVFGFAPITVEAPAAASRRMRATAGLPFQRAA